MNPRLPFLREKAASLPASPGVYLMRDKNGSIIYIGKSKKLQNRVSSYFIKSGHSVKTERMVSLVHDFDIILCDTEIEALTLENTLIKKHTPKYNIKLKDAKSYPYLALSGGSFPRLSVTRERKIGSVYFGPYSGMSVAYDVLDTVRRVFRLPTCKRVFPRDIGKERPCIYRDMGRCIAPCTGEVSPEEYRRMTDRAADVLRGNLRDAVAAVEADMYRAAEEERYEEAARFRDSILSLKKLREKQKVVGSESDNADVIATFSDDFCSVISVSSIRDGKLDRQNEFIFSADEILDDGAITAFLFDHYTDGASIPQEILLADALGEDETAVIEERLTLLRGRRVTLRVPRVGDKKKLCDMAKSNAESRAKHYRLDREKQDKNLILLTSILGLEVVPDRIEAYDISNIGDEHITASMVVYENGGMKKRDYRTFRVRVGEGRDDYASMKEALTRRLSHIGDGDDSLGRAPDLILLDGGRGQVSAVREVMDEMGLDIPLYGMVKDDFHKTRALTDGENELSIAREPGVYALIYRIQEEAHRVAYSRSQSAKRKTMTHSSLESIPGIGPKKAKLLLSAFGGVRKLAEADAAEIAAIRGIRDAEAHAIYQHFHKEKTEP